MKKTIIVLALALIIAFGAFCQSSGPMDLVVVLDTSASMSSSYRETSDYLIGPFLKEFLRIGDTVHLISYSGTPRLEISRRVEAVGDVEAIIGRILLLYPLDPQSDLAGALSFAEDYSSSLPGSRAKKVILVTDGDAPGTDTLVNGASNLLKSRGTELQYIKVPVTGTGPSSGRPAQTASPRPAASQTAASGPAPGATPGSAQTPPVTQQPSQPAAAPASAGTPSQPAQTPQGASPATSQPQAGASQAPGAQTTAPQPSASGTPGAQTTVPQTAAPQTVTSQPASGQPESPPSTAPQAAPSAGAPTTTPGQTAAPPSSPPAQVPQQTPPQSGGAAASGGGSPFSGDIPLPLLIALGILALLLLGLLVFFVVRHLQNSPNRAMAQAAVPQEHAKNAELMGGYAETQRKQARPPLEHPAPQQKPMPKDKVYTEPLVESSNGGPIMLNLFVEDQNTAIGKRNIHAVKSGYKFSIGGGKSDFLVFLVPIPPSIAEVVFDGSNCTFYPLKPKYFPDIGSNPVSNCIGKNIRVISDKNYELFLRMERYEDPLKALNKLLHSISVPGEVK